MGKLLIVGTLAFDAIESPFGKTDKILGGAATFIGLAASKFKVNAGIVSVCGDDFPQEYLDLLTTRNINLQGVEIVKGGKTFFWQGKYHKDLNSRDTLVTELNTLADFNPKVPTYFKDADVVMLGNLHPGIQQSVLDQLTKKPKVTILDTMNYWLDNTLEQLISTLKNVDIITLNDEEARQLTKEYSLVTAAKKIAKMGPKYVIIKKGEHGALLFHKKEIFFAPALPLKQVFDPTGAGDTFAGGLSGYLASANTINFETLKNGVIYGSALASFCVENFGTERMLSLTYDEIRTRLKAFKKLTQFSEEIN